MKKIIFLLSAVLSFTANAQSWNLTGNAGTSSSNHFIGTTDNQPLVFKTKNIEMLRITTENRFISHGITQSGYVWDKNLFFGGGVENTTSTGNTVFGLGSFTLNTTGIANTAFGNNALGANTTGNFNTGIGTNAIFNNTSGSQNVAVGLNSLNRLTTGNLNTGLGFQALNGGGASTITGDNNTGVGGQALQGLWSGASNNTALGAKSFLALRTGNNNIAIGYNNASSELANANNNIYIGNSIQPVSSAPNNELNIGNWIVGNNGTIGIGQFTSQLPADGVAQDGQKYKLFVKDGIRTEKVKVDIAANNGWADYVFEKNYKLMPLNELDKFIEKNGHLPEVPTTEEAIENGVELKEMNILLLKKIEELTLHIIQLNKKFELQNEQIELLKSQNEQK